MPRFVALLLPLLACDGGTDTSVVAERGAEPEFVASAPVLRRLTYGQFVHSIDDVFGEGLVLPTALEPDTRVGGLYAVGAGVTSFSSLGVERVETAAFSIASERPRRTACRFGGVWARAGPVGVLGALAVQNAESNRRRSASLLTAPLRW